MNRTSPAHPALLILVVLFMLPAAAAAQQFHTHIYGPQDGLASGFVFDVEQDATGRLWIATRHGLFGYDGRDFTPVDNDDSGKIGGPRFLEIDARDRLWTVTDLPPLVVICNSTRGERLGTSVPPLARSNRGPSAFALNDRPDGEPDLALATGDNELAIRRGAAWRIIDMDGRLDWISALAWSGADLLVCSDRGLWRMSPQAEPERWTPTDQPDGPVVAIAPDRDGGLWLVGDDWIGRLAADRVEVLARGLDDRCENASSGTSAQEGPCGGLYYGDRGLLFYFDPRRGDVESLDRSSGLVSSGVTDLEMDSEGTVWASSYRGLTKILGRALVGYDRRNGLFVDEVSAVLERRDGTIVLGHSGGLTFLGEPRRLLAYADPNPFMRVMDLVEGPDGALWIAANRAGVARWTPDGGFEWFRISDEEGADAYALLFLSDGTLWTGTQDGLFRLDGDRFAPVDVDPDVPNEDMFVRRLQRDRSGRILISSGLWGLYRGYEGAFERYRAREDDNPVANRVFCAYEDSVGRLWAGTSAGLREAVDGELVRPTAPDPVIDAPVFAILEDGDGRLWYGTDRGVLRRDGTTMTVLDMGNGLIGNEVNRDALVLDSRGRVWIGTEGGVSRYDASFDVPALSPPRVDLDAFEVDGVRVPFDGRDDAPIDLGVGSCDLLIRYAGLSYRDESRLRFRTRLDGAGEAWSGPRVSPLRQERFINMPHGTYRFHVQAVRPDGQTSAVAISPPLVVRPHVWQRGAVQILAALSGLLLLWTLIHAALGRRYTRRLRREVEVRTHELAASEERLRRESARLSAVLEHISDGVMTLDAARIISLCNPGCERITDRTLAEMRGRPLADVLPDVARWLEASPVDGLKTSPEMPVQRPTGGELWLELAATPMNEPDPSAGGVVLVLRDVTRRRRDRHEAMRTQRLESLGVLAGGIAHDFNNLLMAIIGNASLLAEEIDSAGPGREIIRGILTAGERAQQLTGSLLTFARGGAPVRQALALEGVVRESLELAMSGANVEAVLDLPDDLPNVLADPGQLGQVVSNLLINARQAMPEGGRVRIAARRFDGPADGLEGSRFVQLRIEDDGPGIAPDVIEHVFEPYFTTKETGSGLGLAIVYSVVQRHGGAIRVSSSSGGGAVFEIVLPATDLSEAEASHEREAARPSFSRVLVLDDDAAVREVIRRHLIGAGVTVVSAPAGEEAVMIFRHEIDAGRGFDAVILDLTIRGGMGGLEAFGLMREIDPDVVGVAASGYSDDAVMADPGAHGFAAALVKPFERESLMAALERAVDGSA